MIAGPVDVAIPTWNSAKYLRRALAALVRDDSMPRGRLLVVDRASTDGTASIAKEFGAEILVDTASLGSARERALREATSEWLLFLDSDVEVYPGWFADVARFADLPDAAALQPTPLPPWMRRPRVLHDYRDRLFPAGKPFRLPAGARGYTYSTLVRRSVVRDVPLARFEAFEDQALSDGVAAKGAAWWVVPVFPTHHVTLRENAVKARWNAAGRRARGGFAAGRAALETLGGLKDGVVDSVRFADARFLANAVVVHANAWVGYLAPRRYRARHRAP